MKTKNLILLFIALMLMSCEEELTLEDINSDVELTDIVSDKGNSRGDIAGTVCNLNYEFLTIDQGTPGYRSVNVTYDTLLTEEEVHCARYDFFVTYPKLFMGTLQSTDIHVDNWQITDEPMFPHSFPNRLRVNGKVEVETAICIDPRTANAECPD